MVWVSAGIVLFAGAVAILATFARRSNDLGLLSDQWLAQHRGD